MARANEVTFVGSFSIPEGAFNEWTTAITDMIDFVTANSPRLVSFNAYVDEDHTEGTVVYVHPDSESLEQHLELAASRIGKGVQMVRTIRIELYGDPSDAVVDRLRGISEMSDQFPVTVKRHFYGS